jgi:hypothetical protein
MESSTIPFCIVFENNDYADSMNSYNMDEEFKICKQNLNKWSDRITFIRKTSSDACNDIPNDSIDVVYIDGNHDYSYVLKDITAWYPKVKQGGFLNGDDVYSTDLNEHDASGNVTRIWGPGCWGKYGTFKAVVDAQKVFNYQFSIQQTQFIIKK